MADWSKPTITSNYVLFVDEAKNRDIDAITLQKLPLVGPPTGSIKLVRAPVKFQEWDGGAFVDLVLSVAGGGTGSSTPGGAGTALGLGSMAYQNANAVAITGGTMANMTHTGDFSHSGSIFGINATGPGHTLWVNGPWTGNYTIAAIGSTTIGASNGVLIQAGSTPPENALYVVSRNFSVPGLIVRGDMTVILPTRCVIPVGANLWAV